MSKRKKVTYNELMERNDFLLSRLMETERAINYTHTLIISYIDCNKDQEKLKNYLKETEGEQTDRSSSKTNRINKSRDNKAVSKSSELGNSDSKKTNIDKASPSKSIDK